MPDVGVVMPVYEQKSSYLKAAIRSVLAQKYKRFKLVIVIDGASSKVKRVVRKEVKGDPRVRVIVKSRNEGVAKALNRGFESLLRRKDIRYLTWVSSDNIYYPSYLSALRRTIRSSGSNTGLVFSAFRHVDEHGKAIHSNPFFSEFRKWQNQPKENLLDVCFIGVSFMYKRRFAERIGGYKLQPVEDYDYWLRLTDHCDIQYVDRLLMDYRTNSPYSVSRELSQSKTQQRRWRYAFQRAKYNARKRRGIHSETTIVVPVMNAAEETIAHVEALYDQYFSQFKVLILDASSHQEATRKLKKIKDPRAKFQTVEGMSEREAIRTGVMQAKTPFTLVYTASMQLGPYDLQNLSAVLRTAGSHVTAAYPGPTGITVQVADEETGNSVPHLYRTQELKERITSRGW